METIKIFPIFLSSEVLKIRTFLPFVNTMVLRWSTVPWFTLISIIFELSKVPTRVLSFWSPVSESRIEVPMFDILLWGDVTAFSLYFQDFPPPNYPLLYSIHCSWNTSDYQYWIQCLDITIYPGLLSIKGRLLTRLFLVPAPIILESSVLLLEEYFGSVPEITSYPEKKLFL